MIFTVSLLNAGHELSVGGGIEVRVMILNEPVDNNGKELGTQVGMVTVR